MNEAVFTIRRSTLYKELVKMDKSLKAIYNKKLGAVIEFTIIDNFIILVIPGAKIEIPCKTQNTAKFSFDFQYFKLLVRDWKTPMMEIIITDGNMRVDKTNIPVQTTFFQNDNILRSIDLPINFSEFHILQLEPKGFTLEELRFNQLEISLIGAKRRLRANIRKSFDVLKVYGVTKKEIEDLVQSKIDLF